MEGKALLKVVHQKQYVPVIWVKDDEAPKGKRTLLTTPQATEQQAQDIIHDAEEEFGTDVFFTDIKDTVVELTGEFYIKRGYHS